MKKQKRKFANATKINSKQHFQATRKEFITKTSEKAGTLIDKAPGSKTSYTEQSSNNSLAIAARNALENDIPSDGIDVINDEDDDNINNFISRYVN